MPKVPPPASTQRALKNGTADAQNQSSTQNDCLFGYAPPPDPQAPRREVLRWLFGLDLSLPVRNPRRDLSNGFIIAELLSRYHPADIQMHSFINGTSVETKRSNWELISKACRKHDITLPAALVEGTITEAHGVASELLEGLYEFFTGKRLQRMSPASHEDSPGMEQASAATAHGVPPGGGGAGKLKPIARGPGAGAGGALEFGGVQTAVVGDAMELRRHFAAAGQGS